jgi:hypothetical protein
VEPGEARPHGEDCTSHVEVLSIPTPFGEDPEFWPRLGAWLRSTRKARLMAREDTWKKKEKRQRISSVARLQIAPERRADLAVRLLLADAN